jgi:hypothetical protein
VEAEPNATIVAASIPVLRILFRDISNYVTNSPAVGSYLKSNNRSNFHTNVSVGVNTATDPTSVNQDDNSEKSILSNGKTFDGRITQTREIVIDYRDGRGSELGDSEGIELQTRLPGGGPKNS